MLDMWAYSFETIKWKFHNDYPDVTLPTTIFHYLEENSSTMVWLTLTRRMNVKVCLEMMVLR